MVYVRQLRMDHFCMTTGTKIYDFLAGVRMVDNNYFRYLDLANRSTLHCIYLHHVLTVYVVVQLFVLRAESELQAISGDNVAQSLKCLDSLKAQLSCLFGGPILGSSSRTPEKREHVHTRDEMFRPRSFGHHMVSEVKYKGDWMKRPISDDEIAWLAKLLVDLSAWLNESLGLNQVNSSQGWPAWSYVDLSGNAGNVSGFMDTMKIVFLSLFSWFTALGKAGLMFMRKRGLKVNLRILASKKIVMVLLMVAAFSISRKAFS